MRCKLLFYLVYTTYSNKNKNSNTNNNKINIEYCRRKWNKRENMSVVSIYFIIAHLCSLLMFLLSAFLFSLSLILKRFEILFKLWFSISGNYVDKKRRSKKRIRKGIINLLAIALHKYYKKSE